MPSESSELYTIAWITSLPTERAAAIALLDDRHEPPADLKQHPSDSNSYSWGRIGKHHVVIASLPAGVYGMASAATTASNLLSSLPQIKIGLLVGIGGGIARPDQDHDLRLGDVVVSQPDGTMGGVVQYDLGEAKSSHQKRWERKGTLNKPPRVLLGALSALQAEHMIASSEIPNFLEIMWAKNPLMKKPRKKDPGFTHQGFENDRLFPSAYCHQGQGRTCDSCDSSQELKRESRDTTDPEIYYGIIASGNMIVEDASVRDEIATSAGTDCICIEIEAAGLMDQFPCLVIRGICDYADSHKNDGWHRYAAATSAAFAKELLHYVPTKELQDTPRALEILESIDNSVKGIHLGVTNLQEGVAAIRTVMTDSRQKTQINQCLRDLFITDPSMDKQLIQDTGGGLLRDSYYWIIEHQDYQKFLSHPINNLLWIKGDPGKGKTMLLCGIIDELQKAKTNKHLIAYFFCQQTNNCLNNATSVLRGLIYLLATKQPSLVQFVQNKYDEIGGKLFEGNNAWVALAQIFTNMVQSAEMNDTFIVIDALDECTSGRSMLLNLILQLSSSTTSSIKWIISSRNWPDIEDILNSSEQKVRLQLELNQQLVSSAIESYITNKTNQLAELKGYNEDIYNTIKRHLRDNANGTFLWVALVCERLARVERWNALKFLISIPPGLNALYGRMIDTICQSEDKPICMEVLSIISLVYRPITIQELLVLLPANLEILYDDVTKIIGYCGSFLTVRANSVYFIHQSAKDFLLSNAAAVVFPLGLNQAHFNIFSRSMEALMRILRRDHYSLRHPGLSIDDIHASYIPQPDPLAPIRYAALFWVDHLEEVSNKSEGVDTNEDYNVPCGLLDGLLDDGGLIDRFIRNKYLYWLECLSLINSISDGIRIMSKLRVNISKSTKSTQLHEIVLDADRLLRYFKIAIETSPLQAYASVFVFSPAESIVRKLSSKDKYSWISLKSSITKSWGLCLQTLEGHSKSILSAVISPDGQTIVSGSKDDTIKIWDMMTGACRQTLSCHHYIRSVAFSPDGQTLACSSFDGIIKILDIVTSGTCLQTLESDTYTISPVMFSPNGRMIACASYIWDVITGQRLITLDGGGNAAAFSPDSKRLASDGDGNTVKIWDTATGLCLQTLKRHDYYVKTITFSPDGQKLASSSEEKTIKIWNATTGACLLTIEHSYGYLYNPLVFSPDSQYFASSSTDAAIKIWDVMTGECLKILKGHNGYITSLMFSSDGLKLVSSSFDCTIKVWDVTMHESLPQMLEEQQHDMLIESIAIAPDGQTIASGSSDSTIGLWDTATNECRRTLKGHYSPVRSVVFSPDGKRLASGSTDNTIKIWDIVTGACVQTLDGHSNWIHPVIFFPDSQRIASGSKKTRIKIWDIATGICLQTFEDLRTLVHAYASSSDNQKQHAMDSDICKNNIFDTIRHCRHRKPLNRRDEIFSLKISPDGQKMVSCSYDGMIGIWDTTTGE